MSPAEAVRIAQALVAKVPVPVLEPLIMVIEALLSDDTAKARRSLALATARAHKAAVEAMVKKTTGR